MLSLSGAVGEKTRWEAYVLEVCPPLLPRLLLVVMGGGSCSAGHVLTAWPLFQAAEGGRDSDH